MLHVPVGSGSFNSMIASYGTTRPAAAMGTSVTPGTASKSAWVQVQSALANAAYGILININSAFTASTPRNLAVDIGVDLAGGSSYTTVIANLLAGGATTYSAGGGVWFYFPLFIPAGATIAARALQTNASTIRVLTQCLAQPMNPSQVRKGSFCESIGITEGAIVGTTVTSGTTSEGSWTSLGTTANRLWWWQVGVQVAASDTAWGANVLHCDLAVGDATNKDIIIQDLAFQTTTSESGNNPPLSVGVEWDVPAGSTIYTRLQNSGTNDAYSVAAYGCGG